MSEKRLLNNGYLKVVGKTYEWAYNWFFELTQMKEMKQHFTKLNCVENEREFWSLVKMVGIREGVYILEDWLRLDLVIKWCHSQKINYKIDIPDDYPQELPEITLRRIKNSIKGINNTRPFEFLN